jgi:hypothetical protein
VKPVARLIAALWLGSAAFILLAAAAVFRAAGTPTVAADVVGALLSRWHYIALGAPVALLLFEWRRARAGVVAVLFAAVVLASAQALVDVRIRAMRYASPVPISALDRSDPVRRRFGLLHGASSILLVVQTLLAAVHVAREERNPTAEAT